jgi:hypothetical protein
MTEVGCARRSVLDADLRVLAHHYFYLLLVIRKFYFIFHFLGFSFSFVLFFFQDFLLTLTYQIIK